MSDTHPPFDFTYLEPAVDLLKDTASWTYTHVQEVTDALTSPVSVGTYSGTHSVGGGTWTYSVTLHQFLNIVQITGTATRGTTALAVAADGSVGAELLRLSGVPLPVASVALASGVSGTTRASDYGLTNSSGELVVTLNRTQGIGDITVGETLNFSGMYLAAA